MNMLAQIALETAGRINILLLALRVVGVIVAVSLFVGLPVALFFSRKGSFVNRVCWGLQRLTIFMVSVVGLYQALRAFITHNYDRIPVTCVAMGVVIVLAILIWKRAPKPLGKEGSLAMRILE